MRLRWERYGRTEENWLRAFGTLHRATRTSNVVIELSRFISDTVSPADDMPASAPSPDAKPKVAYGPPAALPSVLSVRGHATVGQPVLDACNKGPALESQPRYGRYTVTSLCLAMPCHTGIRPPVIGVCQRLRV